MYRQQLLYRFDLDHYQPLDDQIHPQTNVEWNSLVADRQPNLALELQASQPEPAAHAFLVNGFEQARAKVAMDFDSSADDLLSQLRELQHRREAYRETPRLCASALRELSALAVTPR